MWFVCMCAVVVAMGAKLRMAEAASLAGAEESRRRGSRASPDAHLPAPAACSRCPCWRREGPPLPWHTWRGTEPCRQGRREARCSQAGASPAGAAPLTASTRGSTPHQQHLPPSLSTCAHTDQPSPCLARGQAGRHLNSGLRRMSALCLSANSSRLALKCAICAFITAALVSATSSPFLLNCSCTMGEAGGGAARGGVSEGICASGGSGSERRGRARQGGRAAAHPGRPGAAQRRQSRPPAQGHLARLCCAAK